MKKEKVTIRLDDWTASEISKLCEMTGASKSLVIRTLCLQYLNIKQIDVNVIHELVNKNKNKNDEKINIRIDNAIKTKLSDIADEQNKSLSSLIRDTLYQIVQSVNHQEYYNPKTKTSKQVLKTPSKRIVKLIASNYKVLKDEIIQNYIFSDDVFQDTILLISTDANATNVKSKGALVAHFKSRYNMLYYRKRMQEKERKEIEYADYLQTKEATEE